MYSDQTKYRTREDTKYHSSQRGLSVTTLSKTLRTFKGVYSVHKLDKLGKISQFVETHKLPKVTIEVMKHRAYIEDMALMMVSPIRRTFNLSGLVSMGKWRANPRSRQIPWQSLPSI